MVDIKGLNGSGQTERTRGAWEQSRSEADLANSTLTRERRIWDTFEADSPNHQSETLVAAQLLRRLPFESAALGVRADHRIANGRFAMTSLDHPAGGSSKGLETARAHFAPLEQFLDEMDRFVATEIDAEATLERSDLHKTAQNTFDIEYSLRDREGSGLSFTFIVTGAEAETLLFECDEHPGSPDYRANPGHFDQHVYHTDALDPLKSAVRSKILAHLQARGR